MPTFDLPIRYWIAPVCNTNKYTYSCLHKIYLEAKPNWLGTVFPKGLIYWGPIVGNQMSRVHMHLRPNASQPFSNGFIVNTPASKQACNAGAFLSSKLYYHAKCNTMQPALITTCCKTNRPWLCHLRFLELIRLDFIFPYSLWIFWYSSN